MATEKQVRYVVRVLTQAGRPPSAVKIANLRRLSHEHIRVITELALHERLHRTGTALPEWVRRSEKELRAIVDDAKQQVEDRKPMALA